MYITLTFSFIFTTVMAFSEDKHVIIVGTKQNSGAKKSLKMLPIDDGWTKSWPILLVSAEIAL